MKRRQFIRFALLSTLAMDRRVLGAERKGRHFTNASVPDGKPHRFALQDDDFLLDGARFQIRSGEMHPARIPRSYWRHRIRMAKAMGLNTIALYVMWNDLEREPGVFDLTSEGRDFAAFIAGLKPVINQPDRPGLFFHATLRAQQRGDVYLNMHGWTKGYVWVNNHLLGRYWHIGPQQTLYCPSEWLIDGDNRLLILDLHQTNAAPIRCANNLAGTA